MSDIGYTGWHDPSRISMGRHSYGSPQVVSYDQASSGRVEIGNFCSIAAGVTFLVDGEHRLDFLTTSPMENLGLGLPEGHNRSKGPIRIGHDVWIGRGATILSGAVIETGAVLGAGAVLGRRQVPAYSVVVGNPGRVVRYRFEPAEREALLASEWWNWSDERIRAALPYLRSYDVAAFLEWARS